MRLTPHSKDTFRLIAIGLMVLVGATSLLVAIVVGYDTAGRIRQQLSERSQSIAAALGPSQISKLAGTAADEQSPAYKSLKQQLAAIKKANPDARSIYLMGRHADRLFFYVDSEQPRSSDYSSAGEWYDDGTDADYAMFDTGRPLVEGPVKDSYGTFISGLAPIFKNNSKEVLAVVGIDVGADTYGRDIALTAAVPIMTGLSFILIIAIFEWIRRRNMQLLALRSELVSLASHELRNPITGIRWAADSLQKMGLDEKAQRMAKAIYNNAAQLQASTDDILELSHAMNQRDLNIQPTDITALLHEIFEIQKLSAERKHVTLRLDPLWPPALTIDCDPDQIKRALHNVISNAIKYTGEDTTVTVSHKDAGTMHQILVSDQGIGIPADEQNKVFRGFYRASNAIASKVPGTGLGLYLVKTVFTRHGGNVSFISEENKGTVFIMSLPKRHK